MYLSGAPGTGNREEPRWEGRANVEVWFNRARLGRGVGLGTMMGDWGRDDHVDILFLKMPIPPVPVEWEVPLLSE